MQERRAASAISCLLICTVLGCSGDEPPNPLGAQSPGEYVAPVPGLEIGPIAGLTTAWHPAPARFGVPLGSSIQLRCQARPSQLVEWDGAIEVERSGFWSVAECPTASQGAHRVAVAVRDGSNREGGKGGHPQGSMSSPVAAAACSFDVIDVDVSTMRVDNVRVTSLPLGVDGKSQGWQALKEFARRSIALVHEIAPGHYCIAVDTDLQLACRVFPEALGALSEWRIDGVPVALGQANTLSPLLVPGRHEIEVGPPDGQSTARLDVYRARIEAPEAMLMDITRGVPVTLQVVTDPPGYESHVTWLAATRNGTADPVLGVGQTFTVHFRDTVGRTQTGAPDQWLGVRADNAVFTNDQVPSVSVKLPGYGEVINASTFVVATIPGWMSYSSVQSFDFAYSTNGVTFLPMPGVPRFFGNYMVLWNTKYITPGPYYVRARVTYGGVTATDLIPVFVNGQPQAAATITAAGPALTVRFDGSSSFDTGGSISKYEWDFEDGTTGTGPVVTHTYAATDTYYVALTVTDNQGGADDEHYRIILPSPFLVTPSLKQKCGCSIMRVESTGAVDPPKGVTDFDFHNDEKTGVNPGPEEKKLGVYWDGDDMGFRFEVIATLKTGSKPEDCEEGQRVKYTKTYTKGGQLVTEHLNAERSRVDPAYDSRLDHDDPYDPTDGAGVTENAPCGFDNPDWCDDWYHGGGDARGTGKGANGRNTNGSMKAYDDEDRILWLDIPRNVDRTGQLPASFSAKFDARVGGELGSCVCEWVVTVNVSAAGVVTKTFNILQCFNY